MRRFIGIFLIICGSVVVLWTLLWLTAYFVGRGLDGEGLKASFGHELLFWTPVMIFFAPGYLLIHHGRRLLSQPPVQAFAIGEVIILFAIIGVILALLLPMDNFSFTAGSIISNSQKTVQPLQAAIEDYYAEYQRFPDSNKTLLNKIPDTTALAYVQNISIANGGRIIITYNTENIHWNWAWWHYLLFRKPNDLTGLTLILVPNVRDEKIIWDECSEGTAPQRNRHFKCSGHQ